MSAIEFRLNRFQELHSNPWFNVMNWVLDQMRTPKEERWRKVNGYCFYFNEKDIPKKYWAFEYNRIW